MSKKIEVVQELKAEPVQEEIALVAEEPFRISLKAERVQEPAFAALGAGRPLSSAFELTINQRQPVTIELPAIQTVITLHGTTAGNGTVGTAQAPILGEAR
jgi:hypothetical protein